MNTTLILYCYFLLLLLFYKTEGADPLESLIRNGWLMIRDYGEKVITNIAIPRTSDVPDGVSTAFQLDPNKKKALDTIAQVLIFKKIQVVRRFQEYSQGGGEGFPLITSYKNKCFR